MPGHKAPQQERREQILNAAMGVAHAKRLSGLTIRDVAKTAGLSTGLVLFHFKSRERLIHALLEWLLRQNALLKPRAARRPRTPDGLADLIRDECVRLANTRQRTELMFDYWVTGTRQPELRREMRAAVLRYRGEFRALAVAALRARRPKVTGLTADALAAAAVCFVHGCGMQAVIDPQHFDVEAVLEVVAALIGRGTPRRRPRR